MNNSYYKIYQIKDIENTQYAFLSYNTAKKYGLLLDDYKEVYSNVIIGNSETNDMTILEDIFVLLNTNIPEDFKGHSLSVSDIVKLDDKYYYCDMAGWKDITEEIRTK